MGKGLQEMWRTRAHAHAHRTLNIQHQSTSNHKRQGAEVQATIPYTLLPYLKNSQDEVRSGPLATEAERGRQKRRRRGNRARSGNTGAIRSTTDLALIPYIRNSHNKVHRGHLGTKWSGVHEVLIRKPSSACLLFERQGLSHLAVKSTLRERTQGFTRHKMNQFVHGGIVARRAACTKQKCTCKRSHTRTCANARNAHTHAHLRAHTSLNLQCVTHMHTYTHA